MPLKLDPIEEPTLNLTPMIDVVLNLVIFFLVTTEITKDERQYEVELPKVTDARPLTALPDAITVNVGTDGSLYVGRDPRTPEELEQELRTAAQRYPEQAVVIRGDAQGLYQHVMSVLNICHRANISNVQLANQLGGGP
jgi:biopolymer transport protein ExbD